MPTLHLGVIDLPYSDKSGVTTGQVAEWLEDKYHPMELYYELHQQEVADDLAQSALGALESLLMGAPADLDPFGTGTGKIEKGFKHFLDAKEMEALGYPGVPTQAALKGVNHRLKKKRGPRRPSFIDTGLYQSSFKSWVD